MRNEDEPMYKGQDRRREGRNAEMVSMRSLECLVTIVAQGLPTQAAAVSLTAAATIVSRNINSLFRCLAGNSGNHHANGAMT